MKYGDIIGHAFRAFGSRRYWAYTASFMLAVIIPFMIVAAAFKLGDVGPRVARLMPGGDSAEMVPIADMLMLYAVMLVGGLLAIPGSLVGYGGLVRMSDAVVTGEQLGVGQAWSFGLKRAWRTLGIEAALWAMYVLAFSVVYGLFIGLILLAAVGGSAASESAGPPLGFLSALCCLYPVLLVAMLSIYGGWAGAEALAIRYAMVGGRTAGSALGAGFSAFRHAFKQVVVMLLIVVGLYMAWSMITSIVTTPLYLMMFPFGEFFSAKTPTDADAFAMMSDMYATMGWLYLAMAVLSVPFIMLVNAAWSAFFRRLTGLELPQRDEGLSAAPSPPASYPDQTPVQPIDLPATDTDVSAQD